MAVIGEVCLVESCHKQRIIKWWCIAHYHRWQRYGDPEGGFHTKTDDPLRDYVDRSGGPRSCHEFQRGRSKSGYGRVSSGNKVVYTHRLTWERAYGPIPAGLEVCHSCDNPPCCNIKHLFLGTHAQNMADSSSKGRLGVTKNKKFDILCHYCGDAFVARSSRAKWCSRTCRFRGSS